MLWSVMRATWGSTSYGCKCVTLNKYRVFTLLYFSKGSLHLSAHKIVTLLDNENKANDNCRIAQILGILLMISARGGGVGPSKRLMGMCRWMGSHFHNWTDYNGVTFLVESLEWGRKFSGFLG